MHEGSAEKTELRLLQYQLVVLMATRRQIEVYAADQLSLNSLETLRITEDLITGCTRRILELTINPGLAREPCCSSSLICS